MTIGALLIKGYVMLKEKNIDTYMLDTQLLLAKALGRDKLYIITNKEVEVSDSDCEMFYELMEQRQRKMPIKYILQSCEFMSLDLFVKKGVLIPRPDTEVLVEEADKEIKAKSYKYICDLCCGSGAIGVALASINTDLQVECYDISEDACEVTNVNIQKFQLEKRMNFYKSDLLEKAIAENKYFDAIVSNPPYIKNSIIPTLMEDVKDFEPFIALSGGNDGLEFYQAITKKSIKCLKSNGMLIFEIGHDQKEAVEELMINNGFKDIVCIKDLAGNDRVVKGFLYK
jgi:release factor glutamine methyltransferase